MPFNPARNIAVMWVTLRRHSRTRNRRQIVCCRQLRKAGFKTFLIVCVNLSKLNSDAPAGVVSDTIYNATQCGKVSSRMRNLESDSGGLFDGHLRLHKTPV